VNQSSLRDASASRQAGSKHQALSSLRIRVVRRLLALVDRSRRLSFNLAMSKKILPLLIVLLAASVSSFAQTNSAPGAATAGIVAATNQFLNELPADAKVAASSKKSISTQLDKMHTTLAPWWAE
jgi:uncharacterized membrane protein (DUF485 family)